MTCASSAAGAEAAGGKGGRYGGSGGNAALTLDTLTAGDGAVLRFDKPDGGGDLAATIGTLQVTGDVEIVLENGANFGDVTINSFVFDGGTLTLPADKGLNLNGQTLTLLSGGGEMTLLKGISFSGPVTVGVGGDCRSALWTAGESSVLTSAGAPASLGENGDGPINIIAESYAVTVADVDADTTSGGYGPTDTVALDAGTRAGYTFAGWTTAGTAVTFENSASPRTTFTMPRGAVAVTANWIAIDYGVTLQDGGAGASGGGTYRAGDTVTLDAGSKPGYDFHQWLSSPDVAFANRASSSTTFPMPAENVTVTAEWNDRGGGNGGGGGDDDDDDDGGSSQSTAKNPDGSTTTTVKRSDGTVVETTKEKDGTRTTVETQKDGTVTETVQEPDGAVTETVSAEKKQPDGSTVKTETVVETGKTGETTAGATVTSDSGTGALTVPSDVLDKVADVPGSSLTVGLPGTELVFDNAAIQAILAAGGEAPALVVAPVAYEDLPEQARARLPEATTYGFSVNGGGVDFGEGKVAVALDYTRKRPDTEIAVYHIDDGGALAYVPGAVFENGKVRFETSHWSVYAVVEEAQRFSDVSADAWYAGAVRYAVDKGLFSGTSGATFSPDDTMTRAMLVTVLYRAAGAPDIEGEIWGYPFADVDADAYYGAAVYWARLKGITSGTGGETFSPNGALTREQFAVMLYRYAGSPAATGTLDGFTDADKAGGYAADALKWAVGEGILTGTSAGALNPTGEATRAQVAAMLTRYLTAQED